MISPKIIIKPEYEFYYVGDTVNGFIYFNVIEKIDFCTITLKIKGWESTEWITKYPIIQDNN